MVVSLAPAYLGILKIYRQPGQVVDGLKRLGFYRRPGDGGRGGLCDSRLQPAAGSGKDEKYYYYLLSQRE